MVLISIVVPAYNEEANIQSMYEKLTQELQPLTFDYEIMFINDGSSACKLPGMVPSFYNNESKHRLNFLVDASNVDE